ncbi:hypothetical protein D0T87_07755 [Bacteroides sp. 51]|nr:hypothetical protein [Bacteroides sp. 51]
MFKNKGSKSFLVRNGVFLLFSFFLFIGCENCYEDDIKIALIQAGDNSVELEKVLEYYKNRDRKKYHAACFIITNIHYHSTLEYNSIPDSYHSYFSQIDSIYNEMFGEMSSSEVLSYYSESYDSLRYILKAKYAELGPISSNEGSKDVTVIKADYLIRNIDQAFQLWKENPYARKLNFDDFKEFILPYRTTDETISDKRTLSDIFYKQIYADEIGTVYDRIERYKSYLDKTRWLCYHNNRDNHVGVFDLFINFKSNCHNTATWTTNVLRACGIPTVYEYTPLWQDRNKPHFWCATVDSAGVVYPYTPPENNMMEDWETDLKYAGKVYRRTFGANKNTPYFLCNNEEYIPEGLSSPLLSDQTYRYHQTVSFRMPFVEQLENNLAYLCFFDKNEVGLIPVAWGTVNRKRQEVTFEQIPLNVVFFPAYYQGDELVPFAAPFMLQTNGAISWLPEAHTQSLFEKPVKTLISEKNGQLYRERGKKIKDIHFKVFKVGDQKLDLTALRKYPAKRHLESRRKKLLGSLILASQHKEGPYDTLYTLKTVPNPYMQEVCFPNTQRYKYYFFATVNDRGTNIAHIEFLSKYSTAHHCVKPTSLPRFSLNAPKDSTVLYRIEGTPLNTGPGSEKAFDGNVETFSGPSIIGIDFGVPICIETVRFIPRNGNNMITIGDKYALYYYDMGWQYLATQEATEHFVYFQNVPSNGIYWLANLTRGREELPFYYIDGKQQFINIGQP